jgi:hypothetical protein
MMATETVLTAEQIETLGHLRLALARIGATPLTVPARAALTEAEAALAMLEQPQAGAVDRTVFDSLLAMAGPEVADELVVQLSADLRAVAGALAVAVQALDWAAIRAQTHVLAALSGSAGAGALQDKANALNAAAHVSDKVQCHALAPHVLAGLGRVIGFVEAAAQDRRGRA